LATIEDKTWLSGAISKHLSLNDEYHQMCDMTALPSVMKQCVSGLRKTAYLRSCIMFVAKKLKTHRVIMTGHSYGGMIASLITESLIRNGIDLSTRQNNGVDIHPQTQKYFVCRHHSLPLD
jgi:hypothetical protein